MFLNIVNLKGEEELVHSNLSSAMLKLAKYYSKEELGEVNTTLPTLYVGYDFVQEIYPDVNILENKINDTEYWCFSKEESGIHHILGLKQFVQDVPNALVKNIKYTQVDPIFTPELIQPTNAPVDIYYRKGDNVFFSRGTDVFGFILTVVSDGEESCNYNDALLMSAQRVIIDHDSKVFNFFVDVLGFPETIVERYIPYLIGLKPKKV